MRPDRLEVFRFLVKQLDIIEMIVKEESILSTEEIEALARHQGQLKQIINVSGRVSIAMNQGEEFKIAGGNYVEGDVIKQEAGGDMKGVAAGRHAGVHYSEVIANRISDVATLRRSLEGLANEIGGSELTAQEKAELLPAIIWLSENVLQEKAPADAHERLSPVGSAARWVKDRIAQILSTATGAVASHWAVELVARLI